MLCPMLASTYCFGGNISLGGTKVEIVENKLFGI
jgi:hypothetical protein